MRRFFFDFNIALLQVNTYRYRASKALQTPWLHNAANGHIYWQYIVLQIIKIIL